MHTTTRILAAAFVLFAARTLAGEASATTKGIITDPAAPPPADAVQLIGPKGHVLVPEGEGECNWVFADGVLTASPKWDSMVTKDNYQDFRLHVEFNVNKVENASDPEGDGNSGIYIQKRYEVQILNSAGVSAEDYKPSYGGSIYKIKKPDHLVGKPAGEWQTYDIVFRGARFKDGSEDRKRADHGLSERHADPRRLMKSRKRPAREAPRDRNPGPSSSRGTTIR